MTAAIAEVPREKTAPPTKAAQNAPVVKPAQYPVQDVPVHLIVRSETNRVPEVDDDFIESIRGGVNSPVLLRPLKATIEHVTHQPVTKTPFGLGDSIFKLVYGERRWIAAKRCGHTHIPGIVRELTDTRALEIQVEENEQRDDYKPMERAAAYAHLRAQYMLDHKSEKGFTEEKCCDLIAQTCKNDKIKGRTVQQIIALGRLHKFLQDALNQGEMEASHGYELCRKTLTEEEQLKLLAWIRKETQHSQGDIPSVRRLKREIQQMEIESDERRRQEKLFEEGEKQETASVTFDGKEISLFPDAPLPTSVKRELMKVYPRLTTAHFLKDRRVQLAEGLTGKPFYLTVKELQNVLATGVPYAAATPAQTSAPIKPTKTPKLSSKLAAQSAAQDEVDRNRKQRKKEADQQEKLKRSVEIEKEIRWAVMDAIAKKAKLDRGLIDSVLINMCCYGENTPLIFAVKAFGWKMRDPQHASWNEVEATAKKNVPKMKPAQVAALLVACLVQEDLDPYYVTDKYEKLDTMARRYKVHVGKIRKAVELKAKGQKPKAGAS